jgi:hypothetical protein
MYWLCGQLFWYALLVGVKLLKQAVTGLPPVLEILEKIFCPGMSWNFESVLEFEHFLEKSWKTAKFTSSSIIREHTVPFFAYKLGTQMSSQCA